MDINDVGLWNLAFGKVGHKGRLQSLASDVRSTEADVARTFNKSSLDITLGTFDWWFTRSLVPLAPVVKAFEDWSYCYAIPREAVVPRYVARASRLIPPAPYKILKEYGSEARTLLFTDDPAAVLVATVLITDTTALTPLFVEALTWYRGHIACPMLGVSVDRMSYANKRYEEAMLKAQIDAANSEANHELLIPPEWISGR